ncbi:hypothetical protein DH2020_004068 [Rehmannia glutinosa]|uniref:Uncharacterized protein n=1 Tax=Rehmannia glutinosa TaxID=99300 RepID=A0ABR0XNI4_REHGL
MAVNHHPICLFPYPTRLSISPPDSDEQQWSCDESPLPSPGAATNSSSFAAALSEDNERLRRNNNMLISELAHMRKLYNDIIYFVQNHVKPVSPSNSYSSSVFPSGNPINNGSSLLMAQKPFNHNNKQGNSTSLGIIEEEAEPSRTKLFGVPLLLSKKRLHPDQYNNSSVETINKTRLMQVLDHKDDDDLGLNLMPPPTR